jgi:phage-related protein
MTVRQPTTPTAALAEVARSRSKTSTPQVNLPTELPPKPSIFRPLARRAYQRDLTLMSIRHGFDQMAAMMGEIRSGLSASVSTQNELIGQLKHLPDVVESNANSIRSFEEQFKLNNAQLAQSNELANANLRLQGEALRRQTEQTLELNKMLKSLSSESGDSSAAIDELEQRLERMRQSDQTIASNLSTVAGAIRQVSAQTAMQGEMVAKMQSAMTDRTGRLEQQLDRNAKTQGIFTAAAIFIAFVSAAGVAGIGFFAMKALGAM